MEGISEEMGKKFEKKYEHIHPHITENELRDSCEEYPELHRLIDDMMNYASRYATDVWNMELLLRQRNSFSTEEWQEVWSKADTERSQLHNTLIDSIAILSRNMAKRDLEIEWIRELAPSGTLERARCGKFAIMLMFERYRNYKLSSNTEE